MPISSSASSPRKTLSSKSPTVRTYSSYSLFSALLKKKPRFDTKGLTAGESKQVPQGAEPQTNRGSELHALDSSAAPTSLSNLPAQSCLSALGPKTSPGSLQESLFHQHLDLSKKRKKTNFAFMPVVNKPVWKCSAGQKLNLCTHRETKENRTQLTLLDFWVCHSVAHNFPNGAEEGKVRGYLPGFYL